MPKAANPLSPFALAPLSNHLELYLYFLLGIIALSNNQTDIEGAHRYAIWFDHGSPQRKARRSGFAGEEATTAVCEGRKKGFSEKSKAEGNRDQCWKMSSHDEIWSIKHIKVIHTWFTQPFCTTNAGWMRECERGKLLGKLSEWEEKVRNASGKKWKYASKEFSFNAAGRQNNNTAARMPYNAWKGSSATAQTPHSSRTPKHGPDPHRQAGASVATGEARKALLKNGEKICN